MVDFSDIAGRGFADMGLRRELHNAWAGDVGGIIFLTCDLMNSMSAEAEGINSCYFSKLSHETETYYIGYNNARQFFEFLLANAVIFGKIEVELLSRDQLLEDSYCLEGIWEGKTTSQWYSDSIKCSEHSG
jgi:hypothetical protein